jgi:hypothetical protein
MSKWIRIDEQNTIQEIITYDPNGIINEAFLPLFKGPFGDEVIRGYSYDPNKNTCFIPEGFALSPDGSQYMAVPKNATVGNDGRIIIQEPEPETEPEPQPEPKYISVGEFRTQLTLSEKLIWDNPQNATPEQSSAINTVSADFPQRVDGTEFQEELDLLESVGVIGTGRAQELVEYFN